MGSKPKPPTEEALARGQRIVEARGRVGLSQVGLARALGVLPHTANRWEKQGMLPKGPTLDRLATVLNTTIGWLLTGKGPSYVPGTGAPSVVAEDAVRYESDASAELVRWARGHTAAAVAFGALGDDVRRAVTERVLSSSRRLGPGAPLDDLVEGAILALTGRLVSGGPSLVVPPVDGERVLPPAKKRR